METDPGNTVDKSTVAICPQALQYNRQHVHTIVLVCIHIHTTSERVAKRFELVQSDSCHDITGSDYLREGGKGGRERRERKRRREKEEGGCHMITAPPFW